MCVGIASGYKVPFRVSEVDEKNLGSVHGLDGSLSIHDNGSFASKVFFSDAGVRRGNSRESQ